MKFDMTTPCVNCPFRKEGGIRLHPSRAREIARAAVDAQGMMFPCHKTVDYDAVDEDDGSYRAQTEDQYCAGALAFANNVDSHNQIMRIAMRIGLWDPEAMRDADQCFASVAEMVAANSEGRPRGRTQTSAHVPAHDHRRRRPTARR